jgi:mannitol/fructose-specific phosphotransferase system IIA component (Ntr-type)
MIDRRHFLGSVVGLTLGDRAVLASAANDPHHPRLPDDLLHRRYLADLAACDLRMLGVPRRRSVIEAGHHPVTPDRVLILDNADLRCLRSRHRGLKKRFRRQEDRWRDRCGEKGWTADPLPAEKLDLCVGLMERLTSHYLRSDLFERWAEMLWKREQLGSTGIGYGFGVLHDYQASGTRVETANGIADWWLVLLPGGIEWQALDGEPVHYMVGPVMEERKPGDYLRVLEGISRAMRNLVRTEGFDPAAWAGRLAGKGPVEAAREFNRTAVQGLAEPGRR